MAYSELIKNLDILRTYIRSFYIYGFKTRNQFFGKSPRTYDDEKRRLENYLDGYMTFRPDENGKVTFFSIDSRYTVHNPLYKIFKAKSFTAMDISLHFMLMEYLGTIQYEQISRTSQVRTLHNAKSMFPDALFISLERFSYCCKVRRFTPERTDNSFWVRPASLRSSCNFDFLSFFEMILFATSTNFCSGAS